MRIGGRILAFACGLVAIAILFAATPARAETSFEGKTVTIYIGYGPGGGFDIYARFLARHFSKYLPGNPTVVPKNSPGAGSILLANQIATTLPRDGTAIAVLGNSLYLDQLLGSPNIKFDAAKFTWIGRMAGLPLLLVSWETSDVKTAQDMFKNELVVGVPGAGSYGYQLLNAVKDVMGAKIKLVSGYTSGQETRLAMERGEVEATASIQWTLMREQQKDWLETKKVNLLTQLGLKSYPDLTQVPLIADLAKNDEERQIISVFLAPAEIGRAFVAPPDLPTEVVQTLRTAFMAVAQDPQVVAEADKQALELSVMDGAELQSIIDQISKIPPAVLEKAKRAAVIGEAK